MNVPVEGVPFYHHSFRSKREVVHWIGSGDTNAQGHHTTADAFRHTPIGAVVSSGQNVHKTAHSRYNLNGHYEWSLQISRWQQTCANLC